MKQKSVIKISSSKGLKVVCLFLSISLSIYLIVRIIANITLIIYGVNPISLYFESYKNDMMLSDFYPILGIKEIFARIISDALYVLIICFSVSILFRRRIELHSEYLYFYNIPFFPFGVKTSKLLSISPVDKDNITKLDKIKNLCFNDQNIFIVLSEDKSLYFSTNELQKVDELKKQIALE